jgi:iron complex outermembrane receptor protein
LLAAQLPRAAAQAAQQPPVAPPETVDVTTTVEPMPLSADDRAVTILHTDDEPLLLNSIADYLRLDPSLNLQARAGNNVQTDLSIRGTTFEQSLVLVNGFRINDPESGHLNLDLPLPVEAVSRIDVLHGSGSTFYGSDAIGGAINLITARPTTASIIAKAGFGSFGAEEQHLQANYAEHSVAEQIAAGRDTSDGFMVDRGYHANALSTETWLTTKPGTTDILLALSDRPYGANQFYGPYDSSERTKAWFASAQQQLGARTAASFAYLRHTDLFVLFAGRPALYENNHVSTSWEAALRRADNIGGSSIHNATLSYGVESDGDTIASSNLGHHRRTQGATYANLSLRSLKRLSVTLGAREEILSEGGQVFSPNVAAAISLTSSLRLRGSAGHGFRLPTYTDLFYSDPATIGNPSLKPESAWSFDAGLDASRGRYAFAVTGFRLQQKNSIDYSKYLLTDKWQAQNVNHLNQTGAETSLRIHLPHTQELQFGYTAVRAASPPAGLISEYAYNYAAQNALFAWTGQLHHAVLVSTRVAVIQKTGRTAYPLWDISIARNSGRVRPYLRLLNLANTGYQEIPGVPLEGRSLTGGVAYVWSVSPK